MDQIQHHQRIMITGPNKASILSEVRKVLDYYHRAYDVLSKDSTTIGDGPVVLIEQSEDLQQYAPHIVVVDAITAQEKAAYEQLADGLPKAGTLVYNTQDKLTKEVCDKKRADVYQEPYDGGAQNAAKSLLKRIGISEAMFANAQ